VTNGTAIQPFQFEARAIFVYVVDGEPWFRAHDLAVLLEIRERDLLSALDEDEKMRDTVAGTIVNLVSEPGMYSTVLRSRKPEAARFKRWVTHEVLPTIRRTGTYVTPTLDPLDALQVMVDQMRVQRDHLAQHDRAILELGARTERLEAGYERLAATGFANLRGLPHDVGYLNRLGRTAAAIARRDGVPVEKAHSTIFGTVNAWPVEVWDEALNSIR
jgi:prophage antirepressor-like protein